MAALHVNLYRYSLSVDLYYKESDRWRQTGERWLVTRDSGAQEVEELSILGVHDGSFYELHHRVTTILKLGMTPQTERPCRWRKGDKTS